MWKMIYAFCDGISSDRANPFPVGSNPSSGWLKCVQKLCAGSQRGAWDVHIFSPTPAKSALRQSSLFICKNVIFQMWSGWHWLAQRLKGSSDEYTKCFHSSDLAFSSGASHSSSSRQREPGNMGREKRIPKAVDFLWKSWAGYVRNMGECHLKWNASLLVSCLKTKVGGTPQFGRTVQGCRPCLCCPLQKGAHN